MVDASSPPAEPARDRLLSNYREYLLGERGLTPETVLRYQRFAKRFLAQRASRNGDVLGCERFTSAEVTTTCCWRLRGWSWSRPSAPAVIALRLGHAGSRFTTAYLHADLTIKERARTTPPTGKPERYRPPDTPLAFLERL